MTKQQLAARVLKWRSEKQMSQAQLVKRSGLSRSTVSRLENGERVADTQTLSAVAKGLGIPLNWLLSEKR
jgi:transcriptional regulator with XRE-family HTH domain